MEYRVLGKTGLKVSALGFGASPLGGVFGSIDESDGIRAVHTAIEFGINYLDVSPAYGVTKAEVVLGKALKEIPRDAYYLCTKVGNYGNSNYDFSAERVIASLDESLARLNVDYVDILLCHDIEFGSLDQVVEETIPALRRLHETGRVRFVGISGLPLKIFRYVADRTELDTILSYCHYTLYDKSLQTLIPYLQSQRIGIINASPLGMGLLTQPGPPAWHPASSEIKLACAKAAAYCQTRGVDIAELALQFSVSNPTVATTLVGVASTEYITANVRALEKSLDQALLAEVQAILEPIRNQTWRTGRPENND
jgi:L-galactose dehydrogenase